MNKRHIYFPILLTAILVVICIVTVSFIHKQWANEPIEVKNTLANQVAAEETSKDLKSIIHEAQKNVVQVEAITKWSEKIGSGFLYNNKGDIITNAHVVKEAEHIYIKTADAQTYTAALVGIGEETDIAVIRVPQLANQTPAVFDDEFHAEIGDEIVAVGSPLGFQNSVTLGIISGTNRSFSIDEFEYENVYQISANITHGNSGGPLIERSTGKVIAINSAGTDEGGIGFSIPISTVLEDVRLWSDGVSEDELDYDSLIEEVQNVSPQQLEDDSEYIISYLFDSLAIRDYINAYALLGSEWQTQTSYQTFRENYIHVVETQISQMESSFVEDTGLVKVSLVADKLVRNSNQKVKNEQYQYFFYVGYENGQLKILDGDQTLISSSE
ncbi:trypsin-like serine protease [Aquibacillus halophilus]|uniref:Trypsin-like serine protease n=1 Tax=Aquibacillus halophilus TaxID=930132 RepID=A0A6A8DKU7_9BACI|nr:trypsin-like peptidase domain-containing protein [Aquibacillus halophilus]MRH41862.1 trypsin-like serine protease [Aquibacillus halophilus]